MTTTITITIPIDINININITIITTTTTTTKHVFNIASCKFPGYSAFHIANQQVTLDAAGSIHTHTHKHPKPTQWNLLSNYR